MESRKNYALKASICILLIGILLIIFVFLASKPDSPYSGYSISDQIDVASFLFNLGWETDSKHITSQNSVLPVEFDSVFEEYNKLQIQQGCDLVNYAGKEIIVYTAPILNYGNTTENIFATILVHNRKIIGGDIHSANLNGFMHTLQ